MISVIIDTDMASDDWMAISYLLKHPDVQVKAITIPGTGQCYCDAGMEQALGLLQMSDYTDIPAACGRTTPLRGNRTFPESWRDSVNAFYGIPIPEHEREPSALDAVKLLATMIENSETPPVILALGPLTNLAELFLQKPHLAKRIEQLYIMGGAVNVPGNVHLPELGINNPLAAEWNIYVDPHAASIVFQSGVPITLVPLDATNHAPITREFYEHLNGAAVSPQAFFVYQILTWQYKIIQLGLYYFWDPFAAALVTNNELTTFEEQRLRVVDDDSDDAGRILIDNERGAAIRVAVSADRPAFETLFLDTLNRH